MNLVGELVEMDGLKGLAILSETPLPPSICDPCARVWASGISQHKDIKSPASAAEGEGLRRPEG